MNRKVYKTPEEKIDAMRLAIELRQKWENAIREGQSREEMEEIGLKSPKNSRGIINEQVFFIAEFHLGDHDVFTKDVNGRKYPF